MHDALILVLKGLAGGCLVVAFALLSESLDPKRFAGPFGAAPAVAIAGLTIALLEQGAHEAHLSAIGMIAGGVGMNATRPPPSFSFVACAPALRRWSG